MYANPYGPAPYGSYTPGVGSADPGSNAAWVYVSGVQGARDHIVQPGRVCWMMDNNDAVMYVKAVDLVGTSTLRAFRFTEVPADRPTPQQADMSGYCTRADLDNLAARVDALAAAVNGGKE